MDAIDLLHVSDEAINREIRLGFWTIRHAAKSVGLPEKFLKELAANGEIPALYVDGQWRVHETQLSLALREMAERTANNLRGVLAGDLIATPDKPTDWKEVQGRLKNKRESGDKYTSDRQLARVIGCSVHTIDKAIRRDPKLREWREAGRGQEGSNLRREFEDIRARAAELHRLTGLAMYAKIVQEADRHLEELEA
jgi:hypothetical protein